MTTIKLGDIAKDTITGFEGTVIARTRYMNNCDRLILQPKGVKDGKAIETRSFDEPNLAFVAKGQITALAHKRPAEPVDIGDRVKCKITGVEGIVFSHSLWLNGCSTISVQPQVLKDGLPVDLHHADEDGCEILERAKPRAQVKTGGPRPEPRRPGRR